MTPAKMSDLLAQTVDVGALGEQGETVSENRAAVRSFCGSLGGVCVVP
jgi:hypothetical protein